jgi:thiamine-phosphate pyrophosphorylase
MASIPAGTCESSKPRLPQGVYLILDPAVSSRCPLDEIVRLGLAAGVRIFQLRAKTLPAGEVYTLAASLAPLVQHGGGCFIVNDRCDIALAVGADGVHLGQQDLPLADARMVVGQQMLIGLSTHTLEQAVQAEIDGADYIGFGPIFATTTKSDPDAVVGLEGLRQVRARVRLPIVAIGGITTHIAGDVVRGGADGVAVISAVMAAPDPASAIADLVRAVGLSR